MAVPQLAMAAGADPVPDHAAECEALAMLLPSPTSSSGCALCPQAATLQCLICLKAGVRPAPTFCGAACYREHWRSHKCGGGERPSPSSSPELKPPTSTSQPPPPVNPAIPSHLGVPPPPEPKRPRPQVPGHSRSGSAGAVVWGSSFWPQNGCNPHEWYDHTKWGLPRAHPGMGAFPRALPPEQVVGPTPGWSGYNPSRWGSPPYRYWGNY